MFMRVIAPYFLYDGFVQIKDIHELSTNFPDKPKNMSSEVVKKQRL